jgi:hypothetical protein
MAWIAGVVAAAAGLWQQHDQNRKAKQSNRRLGQFSGRNKIFEDAISGRYKGGGTQFQQDMYKIAQGQDISPYLLSQPLSQVNKGAATNMNQMTAQLGRSNMSGGLANAYALSNRMGQQNNVANLFQNYGQWREGQRRSDLNWLTGGYNEALDRDIGLNDKFQQPGNPFLTGAMAGLGAYAASGGSWGQKPQQSSSIQSNNSYVNSLGSQGNWWDRR